MTSDPALFFSRADASGLAGAHGPDLVRYVAVCGVLLLLTAVLGLGVRKLAAAGLRGRAARRALWTVDVLPLGGRQRIAVVRCYERSYLIGVGEKEVRLLAALDEDEAEHAPADATPPLERRNAGGFLAALQRRAGDVLPARRPPPPAPQKPRLGKGLIG